MAKKSKTSSSSSFSLLKRYPLFIVVGLVGLGGWWAWQNDSVSNVKDRFLQYVENSDIVTLEAKFTPEQIIATHRQDLLDNEKKSLHSTTLKYYPYLLLDVKYPDEQKTKEGVLLWGLNEGEMVLNTQTWETTHGFRDCLDCQANRNDYKIIQTLARRQGSLSMEDLQKELRIERDLLIPWIENAKQKHLVIQKGNLIQLHFENPKLLVTPQTKINQHLVSKPLGEGQKMPRLYGRSQIMHTIQAAFGDEFKVRHEEEVFLPVYHLEILNPDGSIQASEWNALNGQQIKPHYLSKN